MDATLQSLIDAYNAAVNAAEAAMQTTPYTVDGIEQDWEKFLSTADLTALTTAITTARTAVLTRLGALGVDSGLVPAWEALNAAIQQAGLDLSMARALLATT